jgi:hypothetical protein
MYCVSQVCVLILRERGCSSIPIGSAVAVERIFSGGRDTIGLRRASLKAETIEVLMFVKARLRFAREASKKKEKAKAKAFEDSL